VGHRLIIEPVDVHRAGALQAVGRRHAVTGIIDLVTGGMPVPPGSDARALTDLNHRVYNVSSGRSTTNQQVADAVAAAIPGFHVDLPERDDPGSASV
jgi:hypothetical protein